MKVLEAIALEPCLHW